VTVAGRTCLAFTGNVHGQIAALKIAIVELVDGHLGLMGVAHHHESESAGIAGVPVGDDSGLTHGSRAGEEFVEVVFGGAEGKIADVEFVVHLVLSESRCTSRG